MRALIVIKDEGGVIRVCQFIGLVDDEDDTKAVEQAEAYFTQFCASDDKIEKLKNVISKIKTISSEELSKLNKGLFSNSKRAIDYYNEYISPINGIQFLDTLVNLKKDDIKLYSYVKYVNDPMFAPIVFEINYQTKFATVKINGATHTSIDIGEEDAN